MNVIEGAPKGPNERRGRHIGQAFVERLNGPDSVQQKVQLIADTFWGFDCNGFVGTGLQLNGQRRNAESVIGELCTECQAIENVGQIVPYMLIRFQGDLHFNVIELNAGSPNQWYVYGAEFNGIGRNIYTIHAVTGQPKRFRVRGGGMVSGAALIGPAEPSRRHA